MADTSGIPDRYDWARDERPLSTHRAGAGGWLRYNGALVMLAGIALLIGGGLLSLHFVKGPQVGTLAPGAIIAAVSVPLLAWSFVQWSRLVREARLYPDGVLWLDKGRWRGARWEEVEEVYRVEIYVNGSPSRKEIVIRSSSGVKGVLTHALPHWAKLAEKVQMEATMALGPAARARFKAGEAVVFGPVKVSVRGLKVNDEVLHWDDVASIRVANGYLNVVPRGKKSDGHFVSLAEVPNYLVLLKILEDSPGPKPTLTK